MDQLQRVFKALQNAGYKPERLQYITQQPDGVIYPVIRVDTDYDGPYAPKEVHDAQHDIMRIAKRHHRHSEQRGHYTCVLIW